MKTNECPVCGKLFYGRNNKSFCSVKCRNKNNNQNFYKKFKSVGDEYERIIETEEEKYKKIISELQEQDKLQKNLIKQLRDELMTKELTIKNQKNTITDMQNDVNTKSINMLGSLLINGIKKPKQLGK